MSKTISKQRYLVSSKDGSLIARMKVKVKLYGFKVKVKSSISKIKVRIATTDKLSEKELFDKAISTWGFSPESKDFTFKAVEEY